MVIVLGNLYDKCSFVGNIIGYCINAQDGVLNEMKRRSVSDGCLPHPTKICRSLLPPVHSWLKTDVAGTNIQLRFIAATFRSDVALSYLTFFMYTNDVYILMFCVSSWRCKLHRVRIGYLGLLCLDSCFLSHSTNLWGGSVFLICTISYEHRFIKFRGPVSY
jgi:hypothetical protein